MINTFARFPLVVRRNSTLRFVSLQTVRSRYIIIITLLYILFYYDQITSGEVIVNRRVFIDVYSEDIFTSRRALDVVQHCLFLDVFKDCSQRTRRFIIFRRIDERILGLFFFFFMTARYTFDPSREFLRAIRLTFDQTRNVYRRNIIKYDKTNVNITLWFYDIMIS